jgi:hypothetical protein
MAVAARPIIFEKYSRNSTRAGQLARKAGSTVSQRRHEQRGQRAVIVGEEMMNFFRHSKSLPMGMLNLPAPETKFSYVSSGFRIQPDLTFGGAVRISCSPFSNAAVPFPFTDVSLSRR